jgi:hypothetical protein
MELNERKGQRTLLDLNRFEYFTFLLILVYHNIVKILMAIRPSKQALLINIQHKTHNHHYITKNGII